MKKDFRLQTFDARSYLSAKQIQYWEKGKNVTRGWINISCPFCNDHSNHCGISNSGFFSCWLCGEKGSVVKLVKTLEKSGWGNAWEQVEKYSTGDFKQQEKENFNNEVILPDAANNNLLRFQKVYLNYRRFDYNEILKKYKVLGNGPGKVFPLRIIVPFFRDEELLTYVGMAATEGTKIKYKEAPAEKSILKPKSCLYNIDTVSDTAIIVEGITDVWRIGNGAVSIGGKNMTLEQIMILVEKKIKKVFVMLDADAEINARKIGNKIAPLIPDVAVVNLEKGDPADMDKLEVNELRQTVFN